MLIPDVAPAGHDLELVAASWAARGFNPEVLANRDAVLARLRELIPAGANATNGAPWSGA